MTQHPTHDKNIYELTNFANKRQNRLKREEERKIKEQARQDRREKLIKLEILPISTTKLSWRNELAYGVYIAGEHFDNTEVFTKRSSLTSSIRNKILNYIRSSKENLLNFSQENNLGIDGRFITPLTDISKTNISIDNRFNFTLTVGITFIEIYEQGVRNKDILYIRKSMVTYENGGYKSGNPLIDLSNYYLNGNEFLYKN